jgi:hypothetical protein
MPDALLSLANGGLCAVYTHPCMAYQAHAVPSHYHSTAHSKGMCWSTPRGAGQPRTVQLSSDRRKGRAPLAAACQHTQASPSTRQGQGRTQRAVSHLLPPGRTIGHGSYPASKGGTAGSWHRQQRRPAYPHLTPVPRPKQTSGVAFHSTQAQRLAGVTHRRRPAAHNCCMCHMTQSACPPPLQGRP